MQKNFLRKLLIISTTLVRSSFKTVASALILQILCIGGFSAHAMEKPSQTHEERIQRLKELFQEEGIFGLVVPHNDEYQSEDLPEPNKRLEWLTGFSGSAGVSIITMDQSVIIVDGRYTTQAHNQVPQIISVVEGRGSDYLTWLKKNAAGKVIGFDSRLYLHKDYNPKEFDGILTFKETKGNLVDHIWKERPPFSTSLICLYSEDFAGEIAKSKIERVLKILQEGNHDAAIILDLDSIAWLLNLRGSDLPFTPVVLSSILLNRTGDINLITNKRELSPEQQEYFSTLKVTLSEEGQVNSILSKLRGKKVLVDKNKVSEWLVKRLDEVGAEIRYGEDPSWPLRAKKNPIEIHNMKLAHVCDCVALCEFLAWFDRQIYNQQILSERIAAEKLWELRKQTSKSFADFKGHDYITTESFSTISAFGPHAEMAHYSYKEDKGGDAEITGNSLFLIDSGAQYCNGGTTDITRTIPVGNPTEEQKDRFTRVLKGHIALAKAMFPKKTPGTKLDSLTRQFLWEVGLDYNHGTGHGVGSYLAVHESPGSNFSNSLLVPLEEGMILSNEPGFYKKDEYGIRIENLMLVVPTAKEGFLKFETIALAPIDKRLIVVEMLTDDELFWLNTYHNTVFEKLMPHISSSAVAWLKASTEPLKKT